MDEGEDMIKMVMGFPGDGMLMYVSDYPHAECEFPRSPARVKGWENHPTREHEDANVGQRGEVL